QQIGPFIEQLRMSRELARIHCDVDLSLDVEGSRAQPIDRPKTLALFHELGFRTLIDRLPSSEAARSTPQLGLFETEARPAPRVIESETVVVTSLPDLDAAVTSLRAAGEAISLIVALDPPDAPRGE